MGARALHPGGIPSELARHLTPDVVKQIAPQVPSDAANATRKTIPQGAATTVWCGFVARAEDVSGRYCEDCHIAEILDDPTARTGVRSYALDPARAQLLWAKSEEMVGERF